MTNQQNMDSYEPSAAARKAASGIRDVYSALIKEGFTEKQALTIIGQMLSAHMGGK